MNYSPIAEMLQASLSPRSPEAMIACVATQSMHKEPKALKSPEALVERLFRMRHFSPFEHVFATIRLTGVSRSFMSQITRHRHLSFICSSQHYQDYRDYDWYGSDQLAPYINSAIDQYTSFVDDSMPVEEARQMLPNAIGVNMIITANARAWIEMLERRLCQRNVKETFLTARVIQAELSNWMPIFKEVGPYCVTLGKCFEGSMSCGLFKKDK